MPVHNINSSHINDAFHQVMCRIKEHGDDVEGKFNTGNFTKELHPVIVSLDNPLARTLVFPKRGNNPFQALAETIWVMAGRNDVLWLSKFLPRAADFSDDGNFWRAGYGPRIRNWKGCDQLMYVVNILTKDPASRQAIVSIWDPEAEIKVGKSKDYPCCNWVHFMIRNGKLDCTLTMRSNDAIWGWSSINVYEWTVIQEVIASCLGVEVGNYYHLSDSMHVYQHHYKKMDELVEVYDVKFDVQQKQLEVLPPFRFLTTKETTGMLGVDELSMIENYLFEVKQITECDARTYQFESNNLIARLLNAYSIEFNVDTKLPEDHPVRPWNLLEETIKDMPLSDLKVSIIYWYRKNILKQKDGGYPMISKIIKELTD